MYRQGPPSHLGPRGIYDQQLQQGGLQQPHYPPNYGVYDSGGNGYPGSMYGYMGGAYGAPMAMGSAVDSSYMQMQSDYYYKPSGMTGPQSGDGRQPPSINPSYEYNNSYMYGNPLPYNMHGSMGYR